MKYAPLCVLLSLLAAPAMADNLLNRMVNFGREVLDETRKLAPGIQHDRRHEQPAQVSQAAPDDGRHSPAVELGQAAPSAIAPSAPSSLPPAASPSANHGWQFAEEDHLNSAK
ncbi:hypothetical protein [Zobellella iuensis]|uniref:DUF2339 domain-containing protein n=1 Tax=Zobellella iuensis TaxID=2803811 RepID=A0ABS1QV84_9GAMM|nr:hypothetical protein [Zobellella iuensis]MBL1378769.1 hypothetical protein [Zobellella iuensis]